jgi:hypothetical protein
MPAFEHIKPGSRLRGLDPEGAAEVVQVARFGPNALSLVRRRASEDLPSSQENFPRFGIGNNVAPLARRVATDSGPIAAAPE